MTQAAQAAISLGGGFVYSQNFNGTLEPDWILSQVGTVNIPVGGRTSVTNVATSAGGYYGTIIMNASSQYGTPGQTFAPIKTPGSYTDYGFGGKWLVNTGGVTAPPTLTDQERTAAVSFNNIGTHTGISIQFSLGAGDTIDAGEGIFEVWLDNNKVWSRQFTGGGGYAGTQPLGFENMGAAPQPLIQNANLIGTGYYAESWNASATNDTQRTATNWTLESAYMVNITNVAHTSDTLDLKFVWRALNGDWSDEFLAVDNLVVMAPEPSRVLLLGFGFAFAICRRKRSRQ